MASFSKIYELPNKPSQSFFLTWETDFNNFKIYKNGKLLETVKSGHDLLKGIDFQTEKHNNFSVSLSKSKPLSILLNVDGDDYFEKVIDAEARKKLKEFKGISTLFWTVFGLTFLGVIIEITNLPAFISSAQYTLIVGLDIFILVVFGFTAFMLQKERAWAYFVGAPIYIILSILTLLTTLQQAFGIGQIIGFVIRAFFIYYIIKTAPMILRRMKKEEKMDSLDVLDNI